MAFINSRGRTQTSLAEINIIPLVDVVLVLLIIFMLTAPVIQSGIEINVPKTRQVRELTQQRILIQIDREQRLYLQSEPININQLGGKLKEKIKDPAQAKIYLRADEEVPFGTIAKVMDTAKQAGVENISVVTQPLEREKK
ncbi:MAG TPA: biopolymer transporter ExbD [Terriglobia bacterium]|nr:biopolymer transporter ExbD [Terriglobia bacterium]